MPIVEIKCVEPNSWRQKWNPDPIKMPKASLALNLWVGVLTAGDYPRRSAILWLLNVLPPNTTVTKVRVGLRNSVSRQDPEALWDIHPFAGNGQDHPCLFDRMWFWDKCAAGAHYIRTDAFRVAGWYWFDLGAQACIDVHNAKAAVDRFALGFHEEGDNDEIASLSGYYPDPSEEWLETARLEITYEIPPAVGYSYSDGLVCIQCGSI